MVTSFNVKDLVSFGNYLLSDKRKKLYEEHTHGNMMSAEERLKEVSHADVANWKDGISLNLMDKIFKITTSPMGMQIPTWDKDENLYYTWENATVSDGTENGMLLAQERTFHATFEKGCDFVIRKYNL